MNNVKLAAALGAGYVLGRLRKGRWALAVAGMVAGKKISTNPSVLLGELLEGSPQLLELGEKVGGKLAEAGKQAAVAAAGRRIESLTDQLQERTESLRGASHEDDESEEEQEDESTARESSRKDEAGGSKGKAGAAKRKASTSSTSKKAPSRSPGRGRGEQSAGTGSSTRPAKKAVPRKSAAKKTASSSTSRRTTGGSSRKSSSDTRASTRSRSE